MRVGGGVGEPAYAVPRPLAWSSPARLSTMSACTCRGEEGIQFREESRQSPLDQPLWHSPHHDGNKQGDAKEQTRPSDQEGIGGCHRMGAGFHDRS